jgi:hypothetical protein
VGVILDCLGGTFFSMSMLSTPNFIHTTHPTVHDYPTHSPLNLVAVGYHSKPVHSHTTTGTLGRAGGVNWFEDLSLLPRSLL